MLDTFVFDKKDLFLPGADTTVRVQRSRSRRVMLLGGNLVGNTHKYFLLKYKY